MTSSQLDTFARTLVQNVRDPAIRSCDGNLRTDVENTISKRWIEASKGSSDEFARAVIADTVDATISHLLAAIDQELLRLSFTAPDGSSLDLCRVAYESGELSGWYRGSDGWCEKYSGERHVDKFSDLKDFFLKPPEQDA